MDQLSFLDAEYSGKRKQTRREKFLAEMERVVPWARLECLIKPHYPKGMGGRPTYPMSAILHIYCLQQWWYSLSDPAAEDAFYEITSMRHFVRLSLSQGNLPDENTILHFRHLLEKCKLTKLLFTEINAHLQEKWSFFRGSLGKNQPVLEAKK